MMAFQHCIHGEPISGHCPECTVIGLAKAHPARLNECWHEHWTGRMCDYPTRQTANGCSGCIEYRSENE